MVEPSSRPSGSHWRGDRAVLLGVFVVAATGAALSIRSQFLAAAPNGKKSGVQRRVAVGPKPTPCSPGGFAFTRMTTRRE